MSDDRGVVLTTDGLDDNGGMYSRFDVLLSLDVHCFM